MNEACLDSHLAKQTRDIFCCPTTDETPVDTSTGYSFCRAPQRCNPDSGWHRLADDTLNVTLCTGNATNFVVDVNEDSVWISEFALVSHANPDTLWSTRLLSPSGKDSCAAREACCFHEKDGFAFVPLSEPLLLLKPGSWTFEVSASGIGCGVFSLCARRPPPAWRVGSCDCYRQRTSFDCMADGELVDTTLCNNSWMPPAEECACPVIELGTRIAIICGLLSAGVCAFFSRLLWDIRKWRRSREAHFARMSVGHMSCYWVRHFSALSLSVWVGSALLAIASYI
jgi:hypothetical protein